MLKRLVVPQESYLDEIGAQRTVERTFSLVLPSVSPLPPRLQPHPPAQPPIPRHISNLRRAIGSGQCVSHILGTNFDLAVTPALLELAAARPAAAPKHARRLNRLGTSCAGTTAAQSEKA